MGLAERESESAILDALLADCRPGTGKSALVTGSMMTGKTALLHDFAHRIHQSGVTLLSASASHAEQAMPLGVMSQLFGDFPETANGTGGLTRPLDDDTLGSVLHDPVPHASRGGPAPVARALWQAVRQLSAEQPVVICIDDVHYADAASLQCLMYFVRRMALSRVMMVLTECAGTHPAQPDLWAELMRHPGHVSIQLRALSVSGVTAMLSEQLEPKAARRLAPAFFQVSGGNPLLVRTLVDDYHVSSGEHGPELIAGENFRQAVRSCLHRFDTAVVDVARGIAILEEPTSASLMARLFNVPVGVVAAAMETLNGAGILEAGTYRHEAGRAAVLDGLSPAEQAALHNQAALLLQDTGADAGTVGRHLIAGASMDAAWVAPVLREAAELALFEANFDLCIQLSRAAYQACHDEQSRIAIKSTLARAEWQTDPLRVRRHLPELMEAARNERLTGPDLVSAIGYLVWHGWISEAAEAVSLLGAGREADGQGADSLRRLLTRIHPDAVAADQHLTPGHRLPESGGRGGARVVQSKATPRRPVPTAREPGDCSAAEAQQVLQETGLDDPALMPIAVAFAALTDLTTFDQAFSSTLLWADGPTQNSPLSRAVSEAIRAIAKVQRGEPARAREHAHEALTILPHRSWGVLLGIPLASIIVAATWMGRCDEARTYLRIPVPDAMLETPYGLPYLQARGRFNLEAGRFHAALRDFRACGDLMESWGLETPTIVPWRVGVADAYIGLGKNAEAKGMLEKQLASAPIGDTRIQAMALRSMAATAELQRRPALLTEAVDSLRQCGNRLELALAYADLSRTFHELSRYSQARTLARRASRLAQQCGAEALDRSLLPNMEPEPSTAIQKTADPGAKLSNSEFRVVTLAADGYTNRQISSRLCVTISTVEQHLTRAYRKLGVNRRDGLASALRAEAARLPAFLADYHPTAAGAG